MRTDEMGLKRTDRIGKAAKRRRSLHVILAAATGWFLIGPAHGLEIDPRDVRLQVDAATPFPNYRWTWSVECAGQKLGALHVPSEGVMGTSLPELGSLRFGTVADPEAPGRKVLLFRAHKNDGWVAGAPRCELTFSPSFSGKLPVGQDFWYAFGVRLVDWVAGPDEQILMQWHWGNGTIPLHPFFALLVREDTLRLDSKTGLTNPPSKATAISKLLWQNKGLPNNAWTYFVINARISHDASKSPFVKVWVNGAQVVNYSGPIGYNYPEVVPYVKIGHYQWDAAYNQWSTPTKTVLVRAPTLIHDPFERYKERDIRAFVQAH